MNTSLEVDLGGIFLLNDTFNYEDYVAEDGLESKGAAAVLIPLLFSVVLAVGVPGHALVLVLLTLKNKCLSTSDVFILHLGLSDVLLLVTLPFWAAQVAQQPLGWCCGSPWCRINGAVFNISFYTGALLLSCIAAERYLSVIHSVQLFTQKTPRLAHITCVLIWLASILLSIPDVFSLMYIEEDRDGDIACSCIANVYQSKWFVPSRVVHHLAFLLPVVALIIFFYYILTHLQESVKPSQKLSTIMLILALVSVFYLFWSPYNITLIVNTSKGHSKTYVTKERTALLATQALASVHACLRPLVYFALCGKFQKKLLGMVTCRKEECEGDLWELGVGTESAPDQSSDPEEMKQMNNSVEQQIQQGQC